MPRDLVVARQWLNRAFVVTFLLAACEAGRQPAISGDGGGGGGGDERIAGAPGGAGGSRVGGMAGGHGPPVPSSPGGVSGAVVTDAGTDVRVALDGSATGDAGIPGACGALFCEDFESGAIDPMVWTKEVQNGNRVEVQSAQVAHGRFAARFTAGAGSRWAMLFTNKHPASLRKHLFGRASFFVTPQPPHGHTAFFHGGTKSGWPYSDDHLEISGYNNTWQLGFWGQGEHISSGGRIPLKAWSCVEFELDEARGVISVWVDGKHQHTHTGFGGNRVARDGMTDVMFGFRSWHPASYTVDVYMDDLALHDQRIGCL